MLQIGRHLDARQGNEADAGIIHSTCEEFTEFCSH
jgi:hypothetical protein